MWTFKIINVSGSSQDIEDLGITIEDSTSEVLLSDFFTFTELANSDDLRTLINDGDFTANDGSEDLTAAEGVDFLTIENIEHLEENYYSIAELQAPNTSVVDWTNIINAPSFGSPTWLNSVEYRVTAISSTAPGTPSVGDVYIDTDDDHYYKYDGSWQDEGAAVTGDRVINLDDGQQDIYSFTGSAWTASDSTASDNAAVMVEDDGDGSAAQYIYDGETLTWVKIADIDFSGHLDGASSKHDASEIDVENAYSEIGSSADDDLETVLGDINTRVGELNDHLDGSANQHDADEIDDENTYVNIAGSPTNVDATLSAIDTALGTALDHNTLDEAYDEGGAGVGRIITADTGPVKIDRASSTDASLEIVPKGSLPTTNLADGQLDNKGGILCVYDGTRSKWLSVARFIVCFGRRGTTYDQYLNFFVGSLASNNAGLRMVRNATIVSLAGQFDASASGTFQLRKNDVSTTISSLTISSGIGNADTTTNVDLTADDYLQCYINSVGYTYDPVILVELAWRP